MASMSLSASSTRSTTARSTSSSRTWTSWFAAAVSSGNLVASLEPAEADVFVIAVPTPFKGDHEPDLSYVDSATDALSPFVREGNLVILESTSPVGTTERVARRLAAAGPSWRVAYSWPTAPSACCPATSCGSSSTTIAWSAASIRRPPPRPRRSTASSWAAKSWRRPARTAEMCKLVENASRDVNIAFANELSVICHPPGHQRVGAHRVGQTATRG